jgi:hypothetical protein
VSIAAINSDIPRKSFRGLIMETQKMFTITMILLIATAILSGVSAGSLWLYTQKIAGQGIIEYTGNVQIKSVVLDASSFNITFNVFKEGNYTVNIDINGTSYTKTASWLIGEQTITFEVEYPPSPFKIKITVLEA